MRISNTDRAILSRRGERRAASRSVLGTVFAIGMVAVVLSGCRGLFDDLEGIDPVQQDPPGGTLFEWTAGDGMANYWTPGGNGQGVGSVDTDSNGRLRFQVDFYALRSVSSQEFDMRSRTIDVSFLVTGGGGYSAIGIATTGSSTVYSVNNEFVDSFLIQRDTEYYLRLVFDDSGDYVRTLSTVGFGQSDVRHHTGSLALDVVSARALVLSLSNSHNAATTLLVDYAKVY